MTRRFVFLLLTLLSVAFASAQSQDELDAAARRLYSQLNRETSQVRLKSDLETIGAFSSRLAGSMGEKRARELMISRLIELGGKNPTRLPVTLTVPTTRPGSRFVVKGTRYDVHPLWPNLVSPSWFGGSGALTFGGDGSPEALRGKPIRGRILLLEFESGSNWRWLAQQGAAAIVYLPPKASTRNPRIEAEAKFAEVPVRCPRYLLALAPDRPETLDGEVVELHGIQEWKRVASENVEISFPGTGDPVSILAATDAICVAPDLSYGGEAAASLAATLELVRILRDLPGRRPIKVVLISGRYLALEGSRNYVETLLERGESPLLAANIDLTTQSRTLGVFSRGLFYQPREEVVYGVRVFTTNLWDHATVMAEPMGFQDSRECLQDVTNNSNGRDWKKALPGKYAFDSEPFLEAGLNAVTFSGVDDDRALLDTPLDTVDRVNVGNLRSQTARIAACLARALIDSQDPSITNRYRLNLKASSGTRFSLSGGFATLSGQTLYYDPDKGFLPSVEIPGSLVCVSGKAKSFFGVRGAMVQMSDERARYRISGLAPMTSYIPNERVDTFLGAYKIGDLGVISMAAAEGIMGSESYPLQFQLKTSTRNSPIVMFPCSPIDLYGLRDPQDHSPFFNLQILDAVTNGPPASYGLAYARYFDLTRPDSVEDAGVALIQPGTAIKIVGDGGRLLLAGRDGKGIGSDWRGSVALQSATDIADVTDERIGLLEKHRILSPFAAEVQRDVRGHLARSKEAEKALDWPTSQRESVAAWSLALRSYPVVRGTANDVVNGVVFYLLLLLPFSIFLERLIFGYRLLTRRLTATFSFFVAAFLALRFLHPAFAIVPNPWMIFIAFVMGSLSLSVAVLIISKFESGLSDDRAERTGLREVALRRGGAMAVSFALALSNLKRRRLRTWLTAVTLMFTTFLVIGFVGIVPEIQVQANPSNHSAPYDGILLRTPGVDPLAPDLVERFRKEFGGAVARRVFTYGAEGGLPTISLYREVGKTEIRAIAGFDPDEPVAVKKTLVSGRWFSKSDRNTLIVPHELADEIGKEVRILGRQYRVIGTFDPEKLSRLKDLDGDGLMPPDFGLSSTQQAQSKTSTAAFRSYIRLDSKVCALALSDDVLAMNGQVRTVAAKLSSGSEVRAKLDDLMPKLRMNLYAGLDGKVSQFSAQLGTSTAGLGMVVLQLVIAALFVLNTMLASVHERRGEIGILSAIGLAPNQIANLFFAESIVYGVVGSVGGYLISQAIGLVATQVPAMAGLTLNFSSTGAVLASLLVFLAVLLSTIYPAKVGASLAGGASETKFEGTQDGDRWILHLPFTVGVQDADALARSFGEWFDSHAAFSVGVFVSQDVEWSERHIQATVSLVPYDLGVSQTVKMTLQPARYVPGSLDLELVLDRISGDPRNWLSLNRAFLTQIRRHFLTWQASR